MEGNNMDMMIRILLVLSVNILLIAASDPSDCPMWYLRVGENCDVYIPKLNLGEGVTPTAESVGSNYVQLGWQRSTEVMEQPAQVQSHYKYILRYRIKPESADNDGSWEDGPVVQHLPEEEFQTAKLQYLMVDTLYQIRVYLGRQWGYELQVSQLPSSIVEVKTDSTCIAPARPEGLKAHFLGSDSSGGQIELIWQPNGGSRCQTLEDYRLTLYPTDNTQPQILLYIDAAATKTVVRNLQHAGEYEIHLTSVNNAGYYTSSSPLYVNVTKHNDMSGTNCINWVTDVDTTPSSVGSTTANLCESLGCLEQTGQTKNNKGAVIGVSIVAAVEFIIIVILCIILIITLRRHQDTGAHSAKPLPAKTAVIAASAPPLPQQHPRAGLPTDTNSYLMVIPDSPKEAVFTKDSSPYEELHNVQYDNGAVSRDGYEIPHQYDQMKE